MQLCLIAPLRVVFLALTVLAAAVMPSAATAEQPSGGWVLCPGISLWPPCPCFPDDYCAKPMPRPPVFVTCFGPNDYCAKPMPFAPRAICSFGPNDYCSKPMPCVSPPSCQGPNSCNLAPASAIGPSCK